MNSGSHGANPILLNWHNGSGSQTANDYIKSLSTAISSVTGASLVTGSSHDVYRAPEYDFVDSSGHSQSYVDTGYYLTTGAGTVTINFTHGVTQLAIYWGSVDRFNSIHLTRDTNGTVTTDTINYLNLSGFTTGVGEVTQSVVADFQIPTADVTAGAYWTQVSFSSTSNAFEIDNMELWNCASCGRSFGNAGATPEPSSMAMLSLGIAGVLRMARKRLF